LDVGQQAPIVSTSMVFSIVAPLSLSFGLLVAPLIGFTITFGILEGLIPNDNQYFSTSLFVKLPEESKLPYKPPPKETTATTTLSNVSISLGQFSCTANALVVGQTVRISGTPSVSGIISPYSDPTTYQISATNGATTFTLTTLAGGPLITTAGATTGLTFTGWNSGTNPRFYVNPPDINDVHVSQMALTTSSVNATNLPIGITVHSMGFSGVGDDASEVNVEYNLTY
jgi:uncharacterized membrane protein